MDNERKHTTTAGITLLDLLLVVFIVLKLIGKITWSWWWVLAPIWIPIAIFLGVILIALIIMRIEEHNERKRRNNHEKGRHF